MTRWIAAFLATLALATGPVSAEETITMCIDHHPPNHMFPQEMGARWQMHKEPFGAAILQMEEVVTRLGLRLVLTPNIPFNRCLALMREGQVDLMWGLLDSEDRREFMHLVEFRATTPKGFYVPADSNLKIEKFEDLAGLRVGTVLGFKYFPRFDEETELFTKVEASSNERLLEMLVRDRVDAVVMTENQASDLLRRRPNLAEAVKKAPLRDASDQPVHIALAKKSRHAHKLPELQRVVKDMVQEERFHKIREAFNLWYEEQLNLGKQQP